MPAHHHHYHGIPDDRPLPRVLTRAELSSVVEALVDALNRTQATVSTHDAAIRNLRALCGELRQKSVDLEKGIKENRDAIEEIYDHLDEDHEKYNTRFRLMCLAIFLGAFGFFIYIYVR